MFVYVVQHLFYLPHIQQREIQIGTQANKRLRRDNASKCYLGKKILVPFRFLLAVLKVLSQLRESLKFPLCLMLLSS